MNIYQLVIISSALVMAASCNSKKQKTTTSVQTRSTIVSEKKSEETVAKTEQKTPQESIPAGEEEIKVVTDQNIEIEYFDESAKPDFSESFKLERAVFVKDPTFGYLKISEEDSKILYHRLSFSETLINENQNSLTFAKESFVLKCLMTKMKLSSHVNYACSVYVNYLDGSYYYGDKSISFFANHRESFDQYTGKMINLAPSITNAPGHGYIIFRGLEARALYFGLDAPEVSNEYSEYVMTKVGRQYSCHKHYKIDDLKKVSYTCTFKIDYKTGLRLDQWSFF